MNRFFWSCINVLSRGKSIFLCINIKAQAPGSQLWCRAVMSLQFTYVPSFACRGRLRKLRRGCSTVVLYCVTMTWQQICKGSFRVPVAGVLLACDCWTQTSYQAMQRDSDGGKPRAYILTVAVSHVHIYFVKRSMSESVAIFSQVWKIHFQCDVTNGLSGGLSQGVKVSWREPTGDCRRPTSQHSQKM